MMLLLDVWIALQSMRINCHKNQKQNKKREREREREKKKTKDNVN